MVRANRMWVLCVLFAEYVAGFSYWWKQEREALRHVIRQSWLQQKAGKCLVRTEATSGPQKASLSYLHPLSLPPFPLSSHSSSFNDYLNCFFSLPLSPLQAKPIYGGWLCLAPEGTDFDNPMQRSRVRACIIGAHVFSLNGCKLCWFSTSFV